MTNLIVKLFFMITKSSNAAKIYAKLRTNYMLIFNSHNDSIFRLFFILEHIDVMKLSVTLYPPNDNVCSVF
jgi:hypothetical protein